MGSIYIKREYQDELETILYYFHFEGEYAVRQLEIHKNFVVMLTEKDPVRGEYMLYDQDFSDIIWNPEHYITKEEFETVWNQQKHNPNLI